MRATCAVAIAIAFTMITAESRAGGLYFSERGVRPLARGGAFVAGADDIGAMWFNPAGLVDAQGTFFVDAAAMLFSADYQRRSLTTTESGAVVPFDFPSVHGSTPPLAIPTLGIAFPVGVERRLTVGFGVMAPYAPLVQFPETLADGSPSPSRYSLISLNGTLLGVFDLFAAYKISEQLRIGAGFEMLMGAFQNVVDLNANPSLLGAPQDPNYDALSQTRATIFTPSGNAGVTWIPSHFVRFGLSGQLPFWINAPASVHVRVPNAAIFDGSSQVGDAANVKFRLPAHIRAGVEVRPIEPLRVELSYEHQFWSLHDTIDITPNNIQLVGVTGFPSPYLIPQISIPRHFKDSDAIRLGGEYRIDLSPTLKVHVRAGGGFETSAVPPAYLSPLTIDGDKITVGGGVGITINRTRIDATFAYVYMFGEDVSPSVAAMNVINPVSGNPPAPGTVSSINGGHYSASAPIIGLGFQYTFGSASPPPPPAKPRVIVAPPPPPPPVVTVAAPVEVEVAPPPPPPKKKKKVHP